MAEAPRYKAVQKIADGGSAEVFLGEQVGAAGFKRQVVLKRIRPELWADEAFRGLLVEEAHLAMSLHHPNLVEVLDLGESGGRSFLVLELVDGWTLGQVARRGRDAGMPMPPELCVYVAAEICRGLAYAHQRTRGGVPLGVVHRDICPNNVLVSIHGEVKVTDFGIARAVTRDQHTNPGLVRGKPMYMSPEQARAERLDARSDLFSVGTVLYQLLAGHLPFPGPEQQDYLRQISRTDAPSLASARPELPAELGRVVQKAMARDKEQRFASAQELLVALEQVQRTALRPAGRSELEAWLRALGAKDGVPGITRQSIPPTPTAEPEWISLTAAAQLVASDQAATVHVSQPFTPGPRTPAARTPPPARRSRFSWVSLSAAVVVVLGTLWWRASVHPPATRPAPLPAQPAQPATLPNDALGAGPDEFLEYPLSAAVDAGSAADDSDDADDEPRDQQPPAEPAAQPVVSTRVSRSGTAKLKLSARLSPRQRPGNMVAVAFESEPSGVAIRVGKQVLGRTPVTLRFRSGITYDVWFDAPGQPALRQWLMLTERKGKPRVTLRAPVE